MATSKHESGGALVASLVMSALAAGLACSALMIATDDRKTTARGLQQLEARALSEAGVERALSFVRTTLNLNPFDPLSELDHLLFENGDVNEPKTYTVAADEALARNGHLFGTFTVVMTATAGNDARDLTITATGYIPDRATAHAKATTQAVVRAGLQPGKVFDYSYFINNWGWFYGDTIFANGNVRSNAEFDAAHYRPGVYGTPRYEAMDLTDAAHPRLEGYIDDNGDGVMDGSDGGNFAGWDIVSVDRLRGMGGLPQNQHEFDAQVPMPNLNDLTTYETRAKEAGGSLKVGGGVDGAGHELPNTTICNAVLGDEAGERQNLVLIGTAAKPIILNGSVVVRGDVIIKGVVKGQGAIYAGRNIYVADNVSYANAPAKWLPDDEGQAATEAWLATNHGKDFLGLFAKEHVVMGDFTNANWRHYVGWWVSDPMNQSAEDAGLDGQPNTKDGRDGRHGTEDDDTLEGDGAWTVDHYTQAHADLGLIPSGKSVGDVIPGSGEDIDGDGRKDATTTLADFDLAAALASGLWAGNLPAGTTRFDQISSTAMTNVDACVYTNHTCGLLTLAWGKDFNWHGSIVSRNESLVYGTNSMNLTYDRRFTGGGLFGSMIPRTLSALRVLAWRQLECDVAVQTTP